jgi:hypothetical protein
MLVQRMHEYTNAASPIQSAGEAARPTIPRRITL